MLPFHLPQCSSLENRLSLPQSFTLAEGSQGHVCPPNTTSCCYSWPSKKFLRGKDDVHFITSLVNSEMKHSSKNIFLTFLHHMRKCKRVNLMFKDKRNLHQFFSLQL